MEESMDNTRYFNNERVKSEAVKDSLKLVQQALEKKGYRSIDQIVGYLLSGDPVYITSGDNARNIIKQFTRDEIIEALVISFLEEDK